MAVIIPYKQQVMTGCLVACFFMLLKQKKKLSFQKGDEKNILLKASQRTYPYYVVGVCEEIVKKYGVSINIIADNAYFSNELNHSFQSKKITSSPKIIDLKLIEESIKTSPLICHIDDHYLGDYSHASHFIILEKITKSRVLIVDPWYGHKKFISKKTLKEAIRGLKDEIRMCPLLLVLE